MHDTRETQRDAKDNVLTEHFKARPGMSMLAPYRQSKWRYGAVGVQLGAVQSFQTGFIYRFDPQATGDAGNKQQSPVLRAKQAFLRA